MAVELDLPRASGVVPVAPVDVARISPAFVLGAMAAVIVGLSALLGRIGSDAQWLAALGHVIAARHAIPAGVPFAAAPTGHWPNALVLAELIFAGLQSALGDRGLMLAQLLAVVGALAVITRDAERGRARPVGIAAALLLAGLGALPSLAIVRVQLFSIVLFPALAALLRAQSRSRSRAIWWAVPLLAVWSNLHGAALLGAGMLIAYLAFDRARREPWLAVGVAAAGLAALCATPAGLRTVDYYHGLLTNLAAQRGAGMWGPLSLHSPLDVVMVLGGLMLIVGVVRARPRLWEWLMILALAGLTVKADRDGVWLLLFLAVPGARGLDPARSLRAFAPVAGLVAIALLSVALVRGPLPSDAGRALLARALVVAHGTPVLADGSIDEQVALAGGRIWAGNPIDAFARPVQAAYLDWIAGRADGRRALVPAVRVVLAMRRSPTQALMASTRGFAAVGSDAGAILYERRP